MGIFGWLFGNEPPAATLDDQIIHTLQYMAKAGNPAGQYGLAIEYQNGKLINKNDRLAFEWASKSALQGNVGAQVFLGRCYELGLGCSQDISKATEWYVQAARSLYDASNKYFVDTAKSALGIIYSRRQVPPRDAKEVIAWLTESPAVPAQIYLARFYAKGIGVEQNESLAAKYFLRSLELDLENANIISSASPNGERLCLEYADHLKREIDFSQVLDWLAITAERGVAAAQYAMGEILFHGYRDISVNAKLAFDWYLQAALNGEIAAQSMLGRMLANGVGTQQNEKDGVRWCLIAAEQGDIDSQFALGDFLINGRGCNQNFVDGLKWIHLATLNGHEYARQMKAIVEQSLSSQQIDQAHALAREWLSNRDDGSSLYVLGTIYRNGEGIPQDPNKAFDLYCLAAERGYVHAQFYLGLAHEYAYHVPEDFEKAVYWYRKAANQGHTEAQWRLGMNYARGLGVERDLNQAEHWICKSAAQGNTDAKGLLGAMKNGDRNF